MLLIELARIAGRAIERIHSRQGLRKDVRKEFRQGFRQDVRKDVRLTSVRANNGDGV